MLNFDCRAASGLAVAILVSLTFPASAVAARFVQFEILLDGKLILSGYTYDSGEHADIAWGYLKKLEFEAPDRRNIREDERPEEDFVITSNTTDPLRATLKGKVRIFARYAGDVEVTNLDLVRKTKDSQKWRIVPEDVAKTQKIRSVDSECKVRR